MYIMQLTEIWLENALQCPQKCGLKFCSVNEQNLFLSLFSK